MEDRLNKIERLKVVESNINYLKGYLVGIDSDFFRNGTMELDLDTTEFKYESSFNRNTVEFDKKVMLTFINSQIELFEKESERILRELTV